MAVTSDHLITAVHHLMRTMGLSERFACRVTGRHRSTQRREPSATTPDDLDAGLRTWLRDSARTHPRRGFGNAYADARGESCNVNHRKIQRLGEKRACECPNADDAGDWAPAPPRTDRRPTHRTGSGRWTSNSTPPPTGDPSSSSRSSTNTPANASATSSTDPSRRRPHRRSRSPRPAPRLPERAALRQRPRTGLRRDGRLGRRTRRPVLHPTRLTLVNRLISADSGACRNFGLGHPADLSWRMRRSSLS